MLLRFQLIFCLIINLKTIKSNGFSSIVNGIYKPAEPSQGAFPYHASLMLKRQNQYHSFCGGSLIHPRWILTAAHCIQLDAESTATKAEEIHVGMGSVFRDAKGAQILRVEKTVIHPTYLKTDRNDIGLLKLKTAARLGKNVKIVQLHQNNKENLIGKTVFLTGFGITNDLYQTPPRLRKATMHVSNYSKCFGEEELKSVEICATSSIQEGKACKGDSGGPLVIQRNGKYVQVGITSHLALLPVCRVAFNHSVYTRVSAYIAWMSKITGINFAKYNPVG